MYAKNNLTSLGRLHSNAFMKSQSPGFRSKPLSQIQNSLQKMKAKKKRASKSKSRSRSKSKQNTPQKDRSTQKRTSIGSQRGNNLFKTFQPISKQIINPLHVKKPINQHTGLMHTNFSSMSNIYTKTSSLLSIESKIFPQSNTTSYISSEYQLSMSSLCSQKSVKFNDKHIQINLLRQNSKKLSTEEDDRRKTPSILKNKISSSVNSQRSSSIRSAAKIPRNKALIDIQNLSANKIIKSKYEALIKKYQQLNRRYNKNPLKNYSKLQKFMDENFPPHNQSIFSNSIHNKTLKPKGNIIWKRIPQLYPNIQNLIVLRQQSTKSLIKITKKQSKNDPSLVGDYIVNSLNCIRQNKTLLQKMFEIKNINIHGIYLIRIFQQNSWKYKIIDDLIPTVFDDAKQIYVPAFINVEKAQGNASDVIQIWPYLLEKAYATYYFKYQALKYGKQIDFLSELTGVVYRKVRKDQINIKNNEHLEIEALLREQRGIVLGQRINENKSSFFCILPDLNCVTKKFQSSCTSLTKQKNYKPIKQKLQTFLLSLSNLYIYQLQSYSNVHSSYLCQQTKKVQNFKSKTKLLQDKSQDEITLRCFTITQQTRGILSIKQKDDRFYYQARLQYKYIWVRAILLLKEHNGDYRWVDGQYSNQKSLTFFLKLEPGEYYLLLMPQWSLNHKCDLSINFYTESSPVILQKKQYPVSEDIFEKGCADIAQRQGSMHQINKYICAYNYVSQQTGLVIQNINNQRQCGPVTVMRSINGLRCQVDLAPVNREFYFTTNADYDNQKGRKLKKTIEVDINPNEHFTVVLKTVGGIDHKFFDSFDFGS